MTRYDMRPLRALGTLLLLGPALSAQRNGDSWQPSAAVTVGLGVSYAGLGGLGELYIGRTHLSALLGLGGVPGFFSGVSVGARFYFGSATDRLYLEGTVAQLSEPYGGDTQTYGPALLAGYSHIAPGGFTFNGAAGVGRRTDGSTGFALNLGAGYTWYRPSHSP